MQHIAALLVISQLLITATALEPAVLSDDDAAREKAYIRRQPPCAHTGSATGKRVPKVLHQMWWQGEEAIPEDSDPFRATWSNTHPSWAIKTWDETSATQLVNKSYAWFAPTFHTLPSKIQKADASRYVILHSEGGVYADMDIEALRPLDEVLAPLGASSTAHLFEEPATHWDAHDTVISNGMMAAPPAHALFLAILRSIRPVSAVFASSGSHMLQAALTRCDAEEEEAAEAGPSGDPPCGCYVTHSSADFFPLHEAMRQPFEFKQVNEHTDAAKALVEDLGVGSWPPRTSYTAQHWARSWIDPERASFWMRGLSAARANRTEEAEKLLLATVWSTWGHKYKYRNAPSSPDPGLAKKAFERSLHWQPEYGFAHYELGNLALEESNEENAGSKNAKLVEAERHFSEAVRIFPGSFLFENNLGVSLMNQGKVEEAMARFRRVLKLYRSRDSFATIKGLDPEAGALLNIGHALLQLGRRDEAHEQWLEALRTGNYEHAVQAVQRIAADKATNVLPHAAVLDLIFGEALEKEGRSRDAALRYAAAHIGAANLTSSSPDAVAGFTMEAVRERVRAHMLALSETWNESEGDIVGSSGAGGKGKDRVQIVEAGPDGTLTRNEMALEDMMSNLKQGMGR